MSDAISRLCAYAGRLDKLKERYRYLGGRDTSTQTVARHAAMTLAWYEQTVADLRSVCAAAEADDELRRRALALVDAVSFDENGSIVGGHLVGGNGGLVSRDTIKAADALRQLLGGAE